MDESGKKSPGPTGAGTTLDPVIEVGWSVVDFRGGIDIPVGGEELRRPPVDGPDVSSPRRQCIVISFDDIPLQLGHFSATIMRARPLIGWGSKRRACWAGFR